MYLHFTNAIFLSWKNPDKQAENQAKSTTPKYILFPAIHSEGRNKMKLTMFLWCFIWAFQPNQCLLLSTHLPRQTYTSLQQAQVPGKLKEVFCQQGLDTWAAFPMNGSH